MAVYEVATSLPRYPNCRLLSARIEIWKQNKKTLRAGTDASM